jgi:hypothetical protein
MAVKPLALRINRMTAPFTGPHNKAIAMFGPPNLYGYKPVHLEIERTWIRQKPPYDVPLEYRFRQRYIRNYSTLDPTSYRDIDSGAWYVPSPDGDLEQTAYNAAYGKFVEKVRGEQAQLAVTMAERQQAFDMMAKRLTQLRQFVRAVRHFQWDEAWRVMGGVRGVKKVKGKTLDRQMSLPEWRQMARGAGGTYLEFHFGWEPTIKEVMRLVDLLQGDFPEPKITAKAYRKRTLFESSSSGFSYRTVQQLNECGWRLSANIRVTNENALLADQVGLYNPLLFVNELIPYSFLLDWVSNLSEWLDSFYPFAGVTLVDAYRTRFAKRTQQHALPQHPSRERWVAELVYVDRLTGSFPGPTLEVRVPKALSPTRAATAASLLLQHLRRGKYPW